MNLPESDGRDCKVANARRHAATAQTWAWLDNGPGLLRNEIDRERIRAKLVELDRELHLLDVERHRAR